MRMIMIIIYIIGGLLCLFLTIYILDYREKMSSKIKQIKEQKNEIQELNNQLDDLQCQLDLMDEPIQKLHYVSEQILFYMKK